MRRLCTKYEQFKQHYNQDGEVIDTSLVREAWFAMGCGPQMYLTDSNDMIWVPTDKEPEYRTEYIDQ